MRYTWSKLSPMRLGRYADYFVKMELTMFGVDVYAPEVDDRGIDFVARTEDFRYFDVQVKSLFKSDYFYIPKHKIKLRDNLLIAVVSFEDGLEPKLYLMRSTEWNEPRTCLVSRDYVGKASEPEWGFQWAKKHSEFLNSIAFHKQVSTIFNVETSA